MTLSERGICAPSGYETHEFVLRPLLASDAQLDYDAVMESREFLRKWEQSTWPEDNFTVEANREDLVKAERKHASGENFTYTVMNPDQAECLDACTSYHRSQTGCHPGTPRQLVRISGRTATQCSSSGSGSRDWLRAWIAHCLTRCSHGSSGTGASTLRWS
jgi:hypothetical protein